MRCSVGTDQTGSVERKGHIEILQTHIVQHLIVGALKKCRINRRDRLHLLCRKPRREGHRVLLSNPDVVAALWEGALKTVESRA